MPDRNKKFHEFAIRSMLFKGRNDWYFCYLKTERIAHVLAVLSGRAAQGQLTELLHAASALPQDIAHLAAGEVEPAAVLADIFALLSGIRIAASRGDLSQEHAGLLVKEYEQVAERLVQGSHPSPFVTAEDFLVPDFKMDTAALPQPLKDIKDISDKHTQNKGHSSGMSTMTERSASILQYIKEKKSVSIKDIARVVRGCSEKTIQRELGGLIAQGLVRRVGERRWSQYLLA